HHPQSTKGKWNHRADLNTRGFFEPSTSAFFEGKNLIILNHDDYVFGSQLMIDKVSKNNSIYINIDNFISRNYPQNRSYSIINYNAIISQIMHAIRMFE
ncbi:hypothetical protein, partial [Gluconobacter cerinus]|uniref:hypothetical protein n=1 Tax=Gluconobacter cerinus TaxID=38307 RepID=UPI001B8BF3BE